MWNQDEIRSTLLTLQARVVRFDMRPDNLAVPHAQRIPLPAVAAKDFCAVEREVQRASEREARVGEESYLDSIVSSWIPWSMEGGEGLPHTALPPRVKARRPSFHSTRVSCVSSKTALVRRLCHARFASLSS